MALDLRLNPALDLGPYAEEFRTRGMTQVQNLFDDASAAELSRLLKQGTPWRLTFIDNGKPVSYTQEGARNMGPAFAEKMRQVATDARKSYGYVFAHYPMSQAKHQNWDGGHPIHELTAFLDSDPFLNVGRQVTGENAINKTEAMASLYSQGHYLTRHIDHGDGARRAAYIIGMTPEWHPDWGGQLVFYNERKDIISGYTPRFNVVTIFDTKYEHAVTQVSTFAGAGRYSIAGWYRDDPAAKVFA